MTDGRDWIYADLDGIGNGYSPGQAGSLTVVASGDTTAPAAPTGLHVVSASPAGIELAWDAVAADPTLFGYEVLRGEASGGPYATLASTSSTTFTDTTVAEGETFFYVVRSVDTSFNRSGASSEVGATAELRTVTLTFNVTVPATTDGTGRSVYIAGFLDRLDGGLPQWNPGGVSLTRVDATHWAITFTGKESVQLEYKYTLGDWEHVEKDGACGEIGEPAAHAELRHERRPDRQRHRPELAERRALRQLNMKLPGRRFGPQRWARRPMRPRTSRATVFLLE